MYAPRYMYASPSMDKDVNLVRHVLTINLNLIQTRVGWRRGVEPLSGPCLATQRDGATRLARLYYVILLKKIYSKAYI
jgi:hypothetical protein